MTRINTNVSSIVAQKTLARSNVDLQTALSRLSTGLRINVGKDDPAGLIASESLRRDITSIQRAITNTERANQLVATADSALGQVASLLNDIRGLVTEAANAGALSAEQIAANQLQVDSSLEAINRIARVTTFQGRRLLDGSLDFVTGGTVQNFGDLTDLSIDQANLGTTGQVSVEIAITTAATQASLETSLGIGGAGTIATTTVDLSELDPGANSTTGNRNLATILGGASTGQVTVFATDAGTASDGVDVRFLLDAGVTSGQVQVSYNGVDEILVRGNGTVTTATLNTAVDTITGFDLTIGAAGSVDFTNDVDGTTGDVIGTTANGRNAAGSFDISTIEQIDDYNGYTIEIVDDTNLGNDVVTAELDEDNQRILFRVDGDSTGLTVNQFRDAINLNLDLNTIFDVTNETGDDLDATVDVTGTAAQIGTAELEDGIDDGAAGLAGDLVFELQGKDGSQVFQFDSGTTGLAIVSAINLVSDATGVAAEFDGLTGDLTFESTAYGDEAFVDVEVITDEGTFEAGFGGTLRSNGSDVEASVNGIRANSRGNNISISTGTLNLKASLTEGSTNTIQFDIIGGGAQFQLGPNVVTNQQARVGIASLNTAALGGVSGRLYEIASGQEKSLANDSTAAARVVDEVTSIVSELRGRLGAFQRTTLDTNIASLNDTVANLTDAESSIRDADFAIETARLTRAQILVQSGVAVLQIANQNPQNVLALLR